VSHHESISDKVKHAAHDVPALPSNRYEAVWTVIWQGGVISFMVFFLEYVLWAPFWNRVVLPLWDRL
jgi:hypothetical protein